MITPISFNARPRVIANDRLIAPNPRRSATTTPASGISRAPSHNSTGTSISR